MGLINIILRKSNTPALTLVRIYASFYPSNGGTPDNKIYKITPADHMSQ